jgi:fluoride exporter
MKEVLVLGLGGFIGTTMRYGVQYYFSKYLQVSFPLGTFIVNITGCLIIGVLYGITSKYVSISLEWRLFLITGLCGGYTTFSTFAYENIAMLQQGNYIGFATYSISSFVLCLLAVFAGLSMIKII